MRIRVVPVARGLVNPWSLAFLPDGDDAGDREGRPSPDRSQWRARSEGDLPGAPAVRVQGRSGLMDVVLHPQFATNHYVYFSYTKPVGAERQSALTVALAGASTDPRSPS